MNDPLLVRGFERFRNLLRDRQRLVEGNGLFREPICERRSLDKLHHECDGRLP